MAEIDVRDLTLLSDLLDGKHINRLTGLSVKQFNLDRKYSAVYKRLQYLESRGYIQRGYRVNNATTYFITNTGVEFYREAMK